ncbi:MAG TPA: TMEM175 family protein [bacterium]|nr:TMEM175 family protein [bacterium]
MSGPAPRDGGGGPAPPLMGTSRLEAFSDGVFAIAMTLLVLDLKVPPAVPGAPPLWKALLHQWPAYLAFVTSFATVGIMWINHHLNFTLIRRTDHTLLVLNGLLLLGVTFLPFPTALVAAYVGHGERVSAAVYTGTFVVISVVWNVLWRYASGNTCLLAPDADPRLVRGITRAYNAGLMAYVVAFGLGLIRPLAGLLMCGLLAVYFALPGQYHRWFGRR